MSSREELQRAIEAIEIGMINKQHIEGWDFHLIRHEPLITALSALRSELDRIDGCEYCNDGEAMTYKQDSLRRAGYIYLDGNLLTADLYSDSMAVAVCYCPMCGRKLAKE